MLDGIANIPMVANMTHAPPKLITSFVTPPGPAGLIAFTIGAVTWSTVSNVYPKTTMNGAATTSEMNTGILRTIRISSSFTEKEAVARHRIAHRPIVHRRVAPGSGVSVTVLCGDSDGSADNEWLTVALRTYKL